MATNLTIKDPSCLQVIITPWSEQSAFGTQNNIVDNAVAAAAPNSLDVSRALVLQGVFADDGAFATLESTTEEDTFTETADGQVCVFTRRRNNEILTLRLNSCNGFLDDLISLKNRRTGLNNITPVPLHIHVCDLCTGYSLIASCAWMISNPTVSFGNDDTAIEIRFLLVDVTDSLTISEQIFNNFGTGNALDTAINATGITI